MSNRKTIAVCLPGEKFSSVWVAGWTGLFAHLMQTLSVAVTFGYSSNVYMTRGQMLGQVLSRDKNGEHFDYMMWVDDDNTVTGEQVDRLIANLDNNPDLDGVCGWCWIQPDGYSIQAIPSCGMFNGNKTVALDASILLSENPDMPELLPVEYTGFPVVLFRFSSIRRLGELHGTSGPFAPILCSDLPSGFMGEDAGFCKRMMLRGFRLAVNRHVQVPHYKIRAAVPVTTPDLNAVLVD